MRTPSGERRLMRSKRPVMTLWPPGAWPPDRRTPTLRARLDRAVKRGFFETMMVMVDGGDLKQQTPDSPAFFGSSCGPACL